MGSSLGIMTASLRLIHWKADAIGHYDEASGVNDEDDFGDNRAPGTG
jgi:hypothetical protein